MLMAQWQRPRQRMAPLILGFPSRPYSLTEGHVAALEALAPTLDGIWTCEILVNDEGDRWAVFEGHHTPPLTFFVGRNGHRLRLFNMEGEVVAIYDNVEVLTPMLGDAIGRRFVASV